MNQFAGVTVFFFKVTTCCVCLAGMGAYHEFASSQALIWLVTLSACGVP